MASVLWPILRQAIRDPRRTVVIDDQRAWRYLDLVGGALHLAGKIDKVSGAKHEQTKAVYDMMNNEVGSTYSNG